VPQIRPLADIVHYKYTFTYLLTYLQHGYIVNTGADAIRTDTWPTTPSDIIDSPRDVIHVDGNYRLDDFAAAP